jgi:hypothetical protein
MADSAIYSGGISGTEIPRGNVEEFALQVMRQMAKAAKAIEQDPGARQSATAKLLREISAASNLLYPSGVTRLAENEVRAMLRS